MATPAKGRQEGFRSGLNLVADESQLEPEDLRRADNARLTETGGVTKRGGTRRIHASAIASAVVRGGYEWVRASGRQLLVLCNGQLFTGTYGLPMTWSAQTGAFDAAARPQFAGFRDGSGEVCYIADGGLLNKWNGSAVSVNLAGTPNVRLLATHNLRLFGAGDPTNPDVLYVSALSNGDTLGVLASGGVIAPVRTYGSREITGLVPAGRSLLIFHEAGISIYTGWSQDDIAIDTGTRGLSDDVGTLAPDTIVSAEGYVYVLSDRSVYRVSEAGVEVIGQKIEPVIQSLDQSIVVRARAVHHRAFREILFYLPDLGIYVYNYRSGGWTGPWTSVLGSAVPHTMFAARDATRKNIALAGGDDGFIRLLDAPSIYRNDVLSDGTGGSRYVFAAQLRRLFFGTDDSEKSLRHIHVVANLRGSQSAQVQFRTAVEQGASPLVSSSTGAVWGSFTWGAFTWGSGGDSLTHTVDAWGRGRFVDVTLADDGEAAVLFSRVQADAFPLGRR